MGAHKLYSAAILWILWVVHLHLLTAELFAISYLISDYFSSFASVPAGYAAALSLTFLNFMVEPAEMAAWMYHFLKPGVYLLLQSLKAILWSVLFGVGLRYTLLADISPEWLKYLIYPMLVTTLVSFYVSLAYAVVIWYRDRKSGYNELSNKVADRSLHSSMEMGSRHYGMTGPFAKPMFAGYTA